MPRIVIKNDELPTQLLPGDQCVQQKLPEGMGAGYSKIFQLSHGLSYIETRFTPAADIAVLSNQELREPRMVVTLALQGQSRFNGNDGTELVFNQGYTTITAFGRIAGERHYQADHGAILQLRFSVTKSRLEQLVGADHTSVFFDRLPLRLLSCRPISTPSILAAQQLTACHVADSVRPFYREGLALTILGAELHQLFPGARQEHTKFSPQDKAKAMLARDILYAEFRTPPSVAALARRVGTNQCKLKQLFHHFFASTPYGMLLEIRMNHAYPLLKSGQCHVGVVADLVGYRHASNFSTAFARYFGVPPKKIAKRH